MVHLNSVVATNVAVVTGSAEPRRTCYMFEGVYWNGGAEGQRSGFGRELPEAPRSHTTRAGPWRPRGVGCARERASERACEPAGLRVARDRER